MKHLKGLLKYETKPCIYIGCYFLCIHLLYLLAVQNQVMYRKLHYIRFGLNRLRDMGESLFLEGAFLPWMIASLIGMIVLVYFQFYRESEIEGSFLKAMPYTKDQRMWTKLGVGIISYTIPYLLLVIGVMFILKDIHFSFGHIMLASPGADIWQMIHGVSYTLSLFLIQYLVTIAFYMFFYILQYTIRPNILAIGIGSILLMVPVFVALSIESIYLFIHWHEDKFLWPIVRFFTPITYVGAYATNSIELQYYNIQGHMESSWWDVVPDCILKITILILFIGAVGIALRWIQHSPSWDYEGWIRYEWMKKIFIIGFTVCSALLIADLSIIVIANNTLLPRNIVSHVGMLVGTVIGYLVSKRLVRNTRRLGREKK